MLHTTARSADPSPTAHIEALAAMGVPRRYRRGALLIQEGETGDTLYIVLQGRLRAFLGDDSGKELTLGSYGPLEYVGEMSLDGGPRSANVEPPKPALARWSRAPRCWPTSPTTPNSRSNSWAA